MSSIEGFCGGLGSGKTMRMSMRLKECLEEGWNILANYDLHFKFRKINPLEIINGLWDKSLDNSAIGLTEAYTFMDSRFSGSEANRYQSYFLLQTRKRRIKVFYDAQLPGSVDVRLRFITNRIYECHKIVIDKDKDREDIENIKGFIYKVNDDDGDEYYETLDIEEAKKIFKADLYDTHDVLLPQYLAPLTEEEFIKLLGIAETSTNREVFMAKVRIKNSFLTHDKLRGIWTLLKEGQIEDVREILRMEKSG